MLVFSSAYESMKDRAERAELAYWVLLDKHNKRVEEWNDLVGFVNKFGGRKGIRNMKKSQDSEFSKEDIQRLLMLCHPDKHDGKQMATDITVKLLKLKKRLA